MIGKKCLLANCLVSGRLLTPLVRIRSVCRPDIPILAYHRVWDVNDEDAFPFDLELVSASIADFAWQMQYVRDNCNPITFKTLLQVLDGEIEAPPRPVIVTFDDGFSDNHQHAFPILTALGVPATMFISTGYIDGERTYWYDRLACQIIRTPATSLNLHDLGTAGAGLEDHPHSLADIRSRRIAIGRVLEVLKRVPNEQRLELLDQLDEALGVAPDAAETLVSQPMTWTQVREMAAAGIEIGSHTVTHPILSNLNEQDLQFEMVESRQTIERQIDQRVEVISYPVGGRAAFDDRTRKAAFDAGYRLGASYIPGTNLFSDLDHYGLRRQHVERFTTRPYFAAMLGLPEIFQ